MTESTNPAFVKERERARHALDANEAVSGPIIGGPREGMPLSEMCDETAYGAVRLATENVPRGAPIQRTYSTVAILSVTMEADIIRWMRANPNAVEAIMRTK